MSCARLSEAEEPATNPLIAFYYFSALPSSRIGETKRPPSGLTSLLSGAVQGATVIDHTGLTGSYDVTLHWAPDTPVRATAGATDATLIIWS